MTGGQRVTTVGSGRWESSGGDDRANGAGGGPVVGETAWEGEREREEVDWFWRFWGRERERDG